MDLKEIGKGIIEASKRFNKFHDIEIKRKTQPFITNNLL